MSYKTEEELRKSAHLIVNGYVEYMDLALIPDCQHELAVELHLKCGPTQYASPLSGVLLTRSCGLVIRALLGTLGIDAQDAARLSDVRGEPCRIVRDQNTVIGIGHFMEDKFILFDELIKQCAQSAGNAQ